MFIQKSAGSVEPSVSSFHTPPSHSRAANTSVDNSISEQTATLSEPAERPKWTRASKPKVKTGCSSCKQRRIKCDEKRPSCTQCLRSHKACTGYPPPKRKDGVASIPLAIAPVPGPISLQRSTGNVNATTTPAPLLPASIGTHPGYPDRDSRSQETRSSWTTQLSKGAILFQPAVSLSLKEQDQPYYRLFRARTESGLSGYFDPGFWTRRVLQACISEPAIKHSVLALGALYRTLDLSCEESRMTEKAMPGQHFRAALVHHQVAIRQYSEACKSIMSLEPESATSHCTRLMATILLTSFDALIGDHKQAIAQVKTALGLLEQNQSGRQPLELLKERDLGEELVIMFNRLAIQAKTYAMAFRFPEPHVVHLNSSASGYVFDINLTSPPEVIGSVFTSLPEARLTSDRLCVQLCHFVEHLRDVKATVKAVDNTTFPASWARYAYRLNQALEQWSRAFEPLLLSRFDPWLPPLQKSSIAVVKISQINVQILLLTMFNDSEAQFDKYIPFFRTIVDLCQEVVDDDEVYATANLCPEPSKCTLRLQHRYRVRNLEPTGQTQPVAYHVRPSFSTDLGIIPPLFVTATKCREPRIRRQAIALLRSSARREGMWDSELAACIAQWIMLLEEGGGASAAAAVPTGPHWAIPALGKLSAEQIPDGHRVMVKTMDFDLRARRALLTVGARQLGESERDPRRMVTELMW